MHKELRNGETWLDTKGNPIHAHGGHIIEWDDYYYWYGEDRRNDYYVSCYRSNDLFNWEFRKHVLTTQSKTEEMRVRTKRHLVNNDGSKVNIERPKVLYNELSNQFVMWMHYENGKDYKDAACALAVCDTPDGDFTYLGHFNPYGYMSRDCTLYKDEDGKAYFISAARDNADLHVYLLADDYLNVDKLVSKLWQGEYREAPAVFKDAETYYMLSSFCTGWHPNQGKYGTSKGVEEKWSLLKNMGDDTTYQSQPSFVLKTKHNDILYFGDRWNAKDYYKSGYVIYPIDVKDNNLTLSYYDKVILGKGKQIHFD